MHSRALPLALLFAAACSRPQASNHGGSGGGPGGGPEGGGGGTDAGDAASEGGAMSSDGGGGAPGDGGGVRSSCAPASVIFGVAQTVPFHSGNTDIRNIVSADVNGDGKMDLVALEADAQGGVEVFVSQGDGHFAAGVLYQDTVGNGRGMAAGDFDGDGTPDMLYGAFANGDSVDDSVNLVLGKGDGTFGPPKSTMIGSTNVIALYAADLNADGKLDFAYEGQDGDGTVLNAGGGAFSSFSTQLSGLTDGWALGDLNGDGAADVVNAENQTGQGMCVLMNSGSGQLSAAPVCYGGPAMLAIESLAIGDVNGDGKPDVVGAYDGSSGVAGGSNVSVYLGKGDGTFAHPVPATLSKILAAMTLADMNNDGKADIVAYENYDSGQVDVLISNGDGTFATTPLVYPAGSVSGNATEPLVVADFAGNGLRGFAVINRAKTALDVVTASCKK
jgi:hypothetical protein